MIFAYWNVDEGEKCSKKSFLSPHHQMFTLKYVNRILWRICHANRLLDKCLLELSMMEVIRSVLRRVRRRNPPILSDLSRGWIAILGSTFVFIWFLWLFFLKWAILYGLFLVFFYSVYIYNFYVFRWNTFQLLSWCVFKYVLRLKF